MLSLSKRVDYALIALAHLAERPGRVAPAREVAEAYDLPLPLLMNILKQLQQHGLVRSLRGTKGGYEISMDPTAVSLHDLIVIMEGPVQTTECVPFPDRAAEPAAHSEGACSCDHDNETHATLAVVASTHAAPNCACRASRLCPVQAPLKALNDRLVQFLQEVKLADIIAPAARTGVRAANRVDVPVRMIGLG
jgi:Rrf2 family protein